MGWKHADKEGYMAVQSLGDNSDEFCLVTSLPGGTTLDPYIDPPPPVPQSLTPRQGMIMLSRAGLLASVQVLLAGIEAQEGIEARIDFEKATEWKRDWPLLISMSSAAGLSSAQVDQMFVDGAKL